MYNDPIYMLVWITLGIIIIYLCIDIAWRIKQIRKENKHANKNERKEKEKDVINHEVWVLEVSWWPGILTPMQGQYHACRRWRWCATDSYNRTKEGGLMNTLFIVWLIILTVENVITLYRFGALYKIVKLIAEFLKWMVSEWHV